MEDTRCEEGGRGYCLLKKLPFLEGKVTTNTPQRVKNEYVIMGKVLEDISDGCKIDCTLKQVVAKCYEERLLLQIRCSEDHGYLKGEKEKRPIGFNEAIELWVKDRFAEIFAKIYEEKKSNNEDLGHWGIYCACENALARR